MEEQRFWWGRLDGGMKEVEMEKGEQSGNNWGISPCKRNGNAPSALFPLGVCVCVWGTGGDTLHGHLSDNAAAAETWTNKLWVSCGTNRVSGTGLEKCACVNVCIGMVSLQWHSSAECRAPLGINRRQIEEVLHCHLSGLWMSGMLRVQGGGGVYPSWVCGPESKEQSSGERKKLRWWDSGHCSGLGDLMCTVPEKAFPLAVFICLQSAEAASVFSIHVMLYASYAQGEQIKLEPRM